MKRQTVRNRNPRSALLPTLALLLGTTAPVLPATATSAADAPCDKQSAAPATNPCAPVNPCAPAKKKCVSGQSKSPTNPCAPDKAAKPAKPAKPANPCAPDAAKKS